MDDDQMLLEIYGIPWKLLTPYTEAHPVIQQEFKKELFQRG
jgi:hypothetical protein